MHPRKRTSPRRPPGIHSGHILLNITPPIPPSPPPTLKSRLDSLLNSIPDFIQRASESTESLTESIPQQARRLFSKDGPLGVLQFWRHNRDNIEQTTTTLRDAGKSILRRDEDAFKRNASLLDFSWLQNNDGELHLGTMLKSLGMFTLDSLTPWDFDHHDFGLTFATVWEDIDAGEINTGVKLTSTIKPLEKEWKVSARRRLMDLGENSVVFGKAATYLAGEYPAYVGVEADRVWKFGRWEGTKLFLNVNYRSSRKPRLDPIRLSCGVQQDFELAKDVILTLRIGLNPLERERFFVTPVPNGEYF